MVDADLVDAMVGAAAAALLQHADSGLPLVPVEDKSGAAIPGRPRGRDRGGEVLFIDARKLGRMETRVTRVFDEDDVARIASTVHRWRADGERARASLMRTCRLLPHV
jgi:type I restriction enzyme M protein